MPKTIKEVYTDYTGYTTVEYSDDTTRKYSVDDVPTVQTNPLTGKGGFLDSGGVVLAAGVSVVFDDESAATRNRSAIQSALDTGGSNLVSGHGIVWMDGPVYVGDNTAFKTTEGVTLKQKAGTNALMVGTKQLLTVASNVTVTWSAGNTAAVGWTGHGCAVGDAVALQGVVGTTAFDWWEVARVSSVVDADNVVLRLPATPSAAPTGQMTAKRCHRNVFIDVAIDYNFAQNPSGAQGNYARMGVVAGFVADSRIDVRGNDLYKYVCMIAAADNVQGSAVNGALANSDTLKVYGPTNNVTFYAEGQAAEDCASTQMLEPAAFIAYMPTRGNIHNVTILRPSAANTSAGSGPLVVYADDTFYADGLLIDSGEARSYTNTTPGINIKSGVGFSSASSKLRNLTIRGTRVSSAGYAAIELNTKINKLMLDGVQLSASGAATVRLIRVPNGGNVDELTIQDVNFNTGAWPTASGYLVEVGNGGVVGTLKFRRCVFRGSSSLRAVLAASGCAVKTIVFDDCDGLNIDVLARIEQAGITVVIRSGAYSGVLTIVNMRASGTVVLQGRPQISGATNAVVRAEIAGTVVDVYADSPPMLTTSPIATCLTTAVVNYKSDAISADLTATGANKAAGNRCFSTVATGAIPANRPVVCDGTNWFNATNLAQTA